MKSSKIAFVAALCTLFAVVQADARTLYVDASRPNNKGNGLKVKTAKKTIQAAINIAKKGDTIIVYPGTYAKINTKNLKITIKAKNGSSKTTIKSGSSDYSTAVVAKLGKTWSHTETRTYVPSGGGEPYTYTWKVKSGPQTKGTNTKLQGFTIDAKDGYPGICVSGGKVVSCIVQNHRASASASSTTYNANLTGCIIRDNGYDTTNDSYGDGYSIDKSTLNRCQILNNDYDEYDPSSPCDTSKFYNCLFAGNRKVNLKSCTLINCTVADNTGAPAQSNKTQPGFRMSKTKAYNTIFNGVASSQFAKARKNTLKNCYKGASPKFAKSGAQTKKWVEDEWGDGYYETVVVLGDYRLTKGSPCINKGKLTTAQKKAIGKKDLAGKKRIKGKAIDIGCYEY